MGIAWPVPIMVFGAILQVISASYVLSRDPKGRVNQAFVLFISATLGWQMCYTVQLQHMWFATGTEALGFWDPIPLWERLRYFFVAYVGPSLLHLVAVMFLDFRGKKLNALRAVVFTPALVMIGALLFSFFTQDYLMYSNMRLEDGIYLADKEWLYYFDISYNYVFVIIGSAIVLYKLIRPAYWVQKRQAGLFAIAVILAYAASIDNSLKLGLFPFDFEITTLLFTLGIMIIGYGIVKYKLFLVPAVTEEFVEGEEEEARLELEKGFTYLVEEVGVGESYKAFRHIVTTVPGLCITTAHPAKVRTKRKLEKTPIIWLSESTASDMTINPWRLDFEITFTIKNFMESNPETVILIDDIEYLISVNGYEKVLDFMKDINDTASVNNATVIAPMNPGTIEPERFNVLAGVFDNKVSAVGAVREEMGGIEEGGSYLVTTNKKQELFDRLKEYIAESPTLCITKTHPDKFKKMYGLTGVKLYWLTDREHTEEANISPTRLEFELTDIVGSFARAKEGRAVIIDGIELLIQANGLKRVLDYIKFAEDTISSSKGVFIVTMEQGAFKEEELALVEKRFDYIITEDER